MLRFARILDDRGARLLVLHGESGCGKSSFLRAGLIPFLEEQCVGYRFVRDRSGTDGAPVLFVRATNDLAGQLADALFQFCARPLSQQSPGDDPPAAVDLPAVVAEWGNPATLRRGLAHDAGLLGRLLARAAAGLADALVLVIDQAEEIFTLARDGSERDHALEMLRLAAETEGRFKVIASLRTEYYGRFADGLRPGARPALAVREYLLTDFSEAQLAEAILRPTRFPQYGFRYANSVAERLAADVVAYCRNRQDSVLPLAQVICSQLYDAVRQRPPGKRVIGPAELRAIGGIQGGMRRHVNALLARQLSRPDRRAFQLLLTRLYLRQPDGALTTALMPEDRQPGTGGSAEELWTGRMPLREFLTVMTRPDVRLLRRNTLRLGDGEQRQYLSLGHDALAPVADEWNQGLQRRARRRRWLLLSAGACLLALVMTVLAGLAWREKGRAREAEGRATAEATAARRGAYLARMSMARRAWDDGTMPRLTELLQREQPENAGGDDFRGFEWYHWRHLARQSHVTLAGHDGAVKGVAFDKEGKTVYGGGVDGRVIVWDLGTRQVIPGLTQPRGDGYAEITSVAFSPEHSWCALGCADGKVWVRRTGSEPVEHAFTLHAGNVVGLAFSPDGEELVSVGTDGTLHVRDLKNGEALFTAINGKNLSFCCVAFGPEGTVAAGDRQGVVTAWSWKKKTKLWATPADQATALCLAFSQDGKRLACGYEDGTVGVWDEQGQLLYPFWNVNPKWVQSLAFSPDGKTLAVGGTDGMLGVLDPVRGTFGSRRQGHTRTVLGVAFSPDPAGEKIVTGSLDGTVCVWDTTPKDVGRRIPLKKGDEPQEGRLPLALSPTTRYLAGGAPGGGVRLWDMDQGQELPALAPEVQGVGRVCCLAWAPDDRWVASGGEGGGVRLCSPDGKDRFTLRPTLTNEEKEFTCLAFSSDGTKVAGGNQDGRVVIWDAEKREQWCALGVAGENHPFGLSCLGFRRDGGVLAVGCTDGEVRLWDLASRQEVRVLESPVDVPPRPVSCVAFSPKKGDNRIAAGTNGERVFVWNLDGHATRDGEAVRPAHTCSGHDRWINALAFSPDGERIVSAAGDGIVRLWDSRTDHEILTFTLPGKGLHPASATLAFNPEGDRLVYADEDMAAWIWEAPRTSIAARPQPSPDKPQRDKQPGVPFEETGTLVCGHCTLKETDQCSNVLRVTREGVTVDYFLDDNGKEEDHHKGVCRTGNSTEVRVTGKFVETEGRKWIREPQVTRFIGKKPVP